MRVGNIQEQNVLLLNARRPAVTNEEIIFWASMRVYCKKVEINNSSQSIKLPMWKNKD